MSQTPPRKPRFLSSVPAQQEVAQARFGQKPAPQMRPMGPETPGANAQGAPAVKPGAGADDSAALTRTPASGSAANAPGAPAQPALPTHPGAPALQLPPVVPVAPGAPPSTPQAQAQQTIPVDLVRSRLAAAIEALRLQSEKLAEQARADVLEVAFQIARRIVEVEVRQSPEPLFALIRTSLGQLAAARRITLRVSPQDIDALRGPRGQETTGTVALAEIELSVDASLEPGECLIESDLGQIDGRLANRFAELRRQVAEASAETSEGAA